MIFLVAGCLAVLAGVVAWQARAADRERQAFALERRQWVEERRDLNNRIQIPEAAPFLFEPAEDDGENDLPALPGFALDEAGLEEAKRALAEAGYESGPAL